MSSKLASLKYTFMSLRQLYQSEMRQQQHRSEFSSSPSCVMKLAAISFPRSRPRAAPIFYFKLGDYEAMPLGKPSTGSLSSF